MDKKPVYLMTHPDSEESTPVYIVDTYFGAAGAENFRHQVADVEDVETGKQFKEIPIGRLKLLPESTTAERTPPLPGEGGNGIR